MVTGADVQMFGNRNLPKGTPDRPLVTFAVFAYNQEELIREAVQGAFAQTYEPLEIILSDDSSMDGTFEIMKEMAASYCGPHRICLRKSEVNLGTALHVYAVSRVAAGELLVVAAGDDVSFARRVSCAVAHYLACPRRVSCIHSGAYMLNAASMHRVYQAPRFSDIVGAEERSAFALTDRLPFLSPTCSYSIGVFRDFPPMTGGSIIEDGVLALRCLASGDILSIDEPLVQIRVSSTSVGRGNSVEDPKHWNRFWLGQIISYKTKLDDLAFSAGCNGLPREVLSIMYICKIEMISSFFCALCSKAIFLVEAFLSLAMDLWLREKGQACKSFRRRYDLHRME